MVIDLERGPIYNNRIDQKKVKQDDAGKTIE